jgi:hypothetical protein
MVTAAIVDETISKVVPYLDAGDILSPPAVIHTKSTTFGEQKSSPRTDRAAT